MKKYKEFNEEPGGVSEPCASYGMDINRLKVEITQQVMQMDNPRMVSEIQDYILQLTARSGHAEEEEERAPCQYTLEELKEQLKIAREESRLGLGISQEEVEQRMREWICR